MAIIATIQLKGGVSKSTTTANLGGVLARRGRRVLLLDCDPQSSITQGFLGADATAALDPLATVYAAYRGEVARPEQVVMATGFDGLDLVPGCDLAAEFNNGRPHEQPWELQSAIVELLADLAPRYDHVIIDTPPNLGLCAWSALAASDGIIVPTVCEAYGGQGLPNVLRSVELARQVVNPRLRIVGFLIAMYQARRTLHQVYGEALRQQYGAAVFDTAIPVAAEVPEATMLCKPVVFHKPRSAASKAFAALADEVETRVATRNDASGEAA